MCLAAGKPTPGAAAPRHPPASKNLRFSEPFPNVGNSDDSSVKLN